MENILKSTALFLLIFAFFTSSVFADVIYLKNGKIIRGKITEETKETITVETEDMWYRIKRNDIEKIVKEKEEPTVKIIKPEKKDDSKQGTNCLLAGLAGVGVLFLGLLVLSFFRE